jgi:hypothetical protein
VESGQLADCLFGGLKDHGRGNHEVIGRGGPERGHEDAQRARRSNVSRYRRMMSRIADFVPPTGSARGARSGWPSWFRPAPPERAVGEPSDAVLRRVIVSPMVLMLSFSAAEICPQLGQSNCGSMMVAGRSSTSRSEVRILPGHRNLAFGGQPADKSL